MVAPLKSRKVSVVFWIAIINSTNRSNFCMFITKKLNLSKLMLLICKHKLFTYKSQIVISIFGNVFNYLVVGSLDMILGMTLPAPVATLIFYSALLTDRIPLAGSLLRGCHHRPPVGADGCPLHQEEALCEARGTRPHHPGRFWAWVQGEWGWLWTLGPISSHSLGWLGFVSQRVSYDNA